MSSDGTFPLLLRLPRVTCIGNLQMVCGSRQIARLLLPLSTSCLGAVRYQPLQFDSALNMFGFGCRQSYCGSLLLSMGGLSVLEWTRQNLHLTGYLSRHFAPDLAACVGMYIPLMAHGPLWLYWAFQVTRLPR